MDELLGVEYRLERAHEHIHQLVHESRMFMMGTPPPYTLDPNMEPIGTDYIIRAKVNRYPSVRMGMLVADAVHNLRAALDMIAWELALNGPNPPANDDRTVYFPICTAPAIWKRESTQKAIERIPDYARKMIEAFQPYNRPHGLYRLRYIQALDNWAKHKAIPNLFSFHVSRIRPLNRYLVLQQNVGAGFDNGDEICRVRPLPPYPQERLRAYLMVHVGFAKVGPAEGAPLDFLENTYEDIRDTVFPAFRGFFPDD